MKKFFLCALAAGSSLLSGAADNGFLSAGRGTPVIDGKPDDAVWKEKSIPATPFIVQKSNRFAARQTELRFLYDDENLYFSFLCKTDILDPVNNKLHALKANLKEHDSDGFYKDDGVELLLDNPKMDGVFDFAVSASGTFCDSKAPRDDMWNKRNHKWESGAKVVCRRNIETGNGYWSVEAAIPWKSLGGKPVAGTSWKMAAARFEQDSHERSAFQPVSDGIHCKAVFSGLKFINSVPGISLKQLPAFVPGNNTLSVSSGSKAKQEVKTRIMFGNRPEHFRAPVEKDGKLIFPLRGSGAFFFTWSIGNRATFQELFRSPDYRLAVVASSIAVKVSDGTVTVNGVPVKGNAMLQSGSNSIVVKTGAKPSVKLTCGTWQIPFPDGWKKTGKNEYTLNLLSENTRLWPNWSINGLTVNRGGLQQILILPSGIPGKTVKDYTVLLDLPEGMKLLSASGYYKIMPDITVTGPEKITSGGKVFQRYAIRINEVRKYRKVFARHEVLACLIGISKNFKGENASLRVSCSSLESGTMESPNTVAVKALPELNGKQPSRFIVQLWSGFTRVMNDKLALPEMIRYFASAGITEDSNLSGCGIRNFVLINFKGWNFNCHAFLKEHPDCHQISEKGVSSKDYVCTTVMLSKDFAKYFRKNLPAWHKRFGNSPHIDWDFESGVYNGSITCLCERCRKSFAETYKLPEVPSSVAVIRRKYDKQWIEFMNRRFAALVSMINTSIHELLPRGTVFSVYSGYQSENTKSFYGVDWRLLNGKMDYAMAGYGRNAKDLAATRQALPDTKIVLGELLYPYRTTEFFAPTVATAATLMRRACDAKGGILIFAYYTMDGKSFSALAETTRAIAENEPFFLAGKRCGKLLAVRGFSDADKEVLKDEKGNLLVVIMNESTQKRSFSAKLALPAGKKLFDTKGKEVKSEFSGTIPAGKFVIYRTR